MAVTTDILRAWRDPRGVIRQKLADGPREDRALAVMMGACGLVFVSTWPESARRVELATQQGGDSPDLAALMGINLFVMIFVLPLILYGVALVSHLVARAFGGRGSQWGARMALGWGLLAASPALLFHGLLRGIVGESTGVSVAGGLVFVGFLWIWLSMLVEAQK